MGTFQDIRKLIETRLSTKYSDTDISWDNVPYTPNPETAFIRPLINEVSANQISMATIPCHRIVGILHILIMVPKNTGTNTARGYGDTLSGIFRNANFDDITFRSPKIVRVGEAGEHFQYSWLCDFWVDNVLANAV